MKLYADAPAHRLRQVTGDLLVVAWVWVWIRLASVVHDATLSLARPGEEISQAGNGLAARLRAAGAAVEGVPVVGDEIRAPFDGAGGAAQRIAAAGDAQVEAVGDLAFWLRLCVAAIPILLALAVYLPLRWRFVREATAGARFVDSSQDLDLFALRAMARQPMHRLARISDDPAGAWRAGDPDVIHRLAALELRESGLRMPSRGRG